MDDSKKPKYTDAALMQQISQYFAPARHWEQCLTPMTTDQFFPLVMELLPGFFESDDHLRRILQLMNFKYSLNEHNNKYYWLANHI